MVTPGTGTTAPSIIPYEFHQRPRHLPVERPAQQVPKSLQQIIEYNNANPVEGLKFGQSGLLAAEAVEYTNPTTTATYRGKPRARARPKTGR